MTCTIDWNVLNFSEWEQRFKQISRSTLLQSYAYARAACRVHRQKARWGLISREGHEAGLVQMLEAGLLGNTLHVVMIDRGPLWFDGYGKPADFQAFAREFSRQFPPRPGRLRRFIPEIPADENTENIIREQRFKRKNIPGYQTIWLDLRQDEDALLKDLDPKWRGKLRKAQKKNLQIDWDENGRHFSWLLDVYARDKKQRNYDGPSVELLKALAQSFGPEKNMLIGRTMMDNKPCAAILVLCHGASATYQIGWASLEGRDNAAHSLLLWQVLGLLKAKGIKDFDLGGVNDGSASGVKQFKQGMGGALVSLPGLYT